MIYGADLANLCFKSALISYSMTKNENKMTKQKRNVICYLHIFGGAIIATHVYSLWNEVIWFDLTVKTIFLPLIILSGLYMWPFTNKLLRKVNN